MANRRRQSHCICLVPLLGFALAAGCGTPESGAEEETTQRVETLSVPFENPSALIRQVAVEGDLCPPGSFAVSVSPDQHALTVTFSNTLGGKAETASATCSILVEMDAPNGYQPGGPNTRWFGAGSESTIARTYRFEGGEATTPIVSELVDGQDFHFPDTPKLWPPSCGETQRVRFIATVEASVRGSDGLFALDSFDLDTTWRYGAEWRRGCGDSSVIVEAPPGEAGDWCGGPHERVCQAAFGCEYDLNRQPESEGTCVDPSEVVAPAGLDAPCGGLRQIACIDGLVCWKANQEAVDNQWLGRCVASEGDREATCGTGIPELPCREGLFCALESHRCVEADGQVGSRCGEGLPQCLQGLRCNGATCAVPRDNVFYFRSNATGWSLDESTRLLPFVAPKVFARTFDVTEPSMLSDGDSAAVTATDKLGTTATFFGAASGLVVVPGSDQLLVQPTSDARFDVKYRVLGRHRALVNLSVVPPTLSIESAADVCANVFCPSRLHCELMANGQPTCVVNP